jgi:hypothetical protein
VPTGRIPDPTLLVTVNVTDHNPSIWAPGLNVTAVDVGGAAMIGTVVGATSAGLGDGATGTYMTTDVGVGGVGLSLDGIGISAGRAACVATDCM